MKFEIHIDADRTRLRRFVVRCVLFAGIFALVATPMWLYGGNVATLKSFTGGSLALAADVNANFAAVKTAVDDNNTRLAALEAALSPKTAPNTLTTLSVFVDATNNTLAVTSTTGYPSSGTLVVENEAMTYTGTTATSFTGLTRGANGTTAISHNPTTIVDLVVLTLKDSSANTRIESLASGGLRGVGIVPIGSIIAWHKSLIGIPRLPDGYVECNGGNVADAASPINNRPIPDLNAGNRFLRGNGTSGGVGGSTTTGTSNSNQGDQQGSGGTLPTTSHGHSFAPPYMDVVWIMRIR